MKGLIFSCDLGSLYPAVHFLRIAITNNKMVPGICLSGSLPLLSFFLLLSIPLSRFPLLLLLLLYAFWVFPRVLSGGFHWCPRDSKSPHFSWTLFGIHANFNTDIIWTPSICLRIFSSPVSFQVSLQLFQRLWLLLVLLSSTYFIDFNFLFLFQSKANFMYLSFFLSFNFMQ